MWGFSAAVFRGSRLILEISLMIRDVDLLRDDQWERLKEFVPGGRKGKRGPRTDNRRFLNALLWMARSGGRWRDLPERLGDYETVKRRYYRWIEMGVVDDILAALAREADLEWLMIDSTIVRAHQQAAGARRQKGGRMPKALVAPAGA
jgi:transposase